MHIRKAGETYNFPQKLPKRDRNPRRSRRRKRRGAPSKTSLEGWKQMLNLILHPLRLPSKTSLEGWKLAPARALAGRVFVLKNFLRGMETLEWQAFLGPTETSKTSLEGWKPKGLFDSNWNQAYLKNFLRGMETWVIHAQPIDPIIPQKLP